MSTAPSAPTSTPAWNLRRVPCNLCGERSCTEIYPSRLPDLSRRDIQDLYACTSSAYGECGPIVRCDACGFIYQNPQPDPDSILAAYEGVIDSRYDEEREGRVHTFGGELARLEAHLTPGALLDVGAHIGVFVEVARDRGWNAEGVEPSRWAVDMARARGLPMTCGTVDDLPVPRPPFDVVTLWDVIEHLPDPLFEVGRLKRLLRPGGILAISTMDIDAPVARLLGRHWPWYMQMHLVYFSRATLRRLVEQAGYEVVELRRHRRVVRLSYLASRLEHRLGPASQLLVGALDRTGLGSRLVTVDLGDVVTMFARNPGPARNGHLTH